MIVKSNECTEPVRFPRSERSDVCYNSPMERMPEQLPEPLRDTEELIVESEVQDEQSEFGLDEFATKLSEHLIGMKIDDPQIVERLVEDQKVIRAKYGLPSVDSMPSPSEYERLLRNIAEDLGAEIKSTDEFGKFFDESHAGGVYFEDQNKIGVDINYATRESYIRSINVLEHELIHALQHRNSPRMPIELMEYEAYIAGGNNEALRDDPELVDFVFRYLIGNSVSHWYSFESKKRGEDISPAWL